MSMRTLIMIIILAIAFSGYSAAAHAFSMESCDPVAIEQPVHCADHQDSKSSDHSADTHKSATNACLDCHHCCASHAVGLSDYSVIHPPQAERHVATLADGYSDYFSFSLLRPPRTLI